MIVSSTFLRRALAADALASGATGVLLAAGGDVLAGLTGLESALGQPLGLFFMGYAAIVAWMASRAALPKVMAWTVIAANLAWAAESLLSLATGFITPTALGVAFVIVQALAVAVFAQLQFMGLRRSQQLAR